jgi:hypothetical protein
MDAMSPWRRWSLGLALSLLCPLVHAQGAGAPTDADTLEVPIKAAFLFKFGEFVDWPPAAFAEPDTPFGIAVLGADALAANLELLAAQRKVNGRQVVVKRLKRLEPIPHAHILFVGAAEADRLRGAGEALRDANVLTVTDGSRTTGIVNFVIRDNRVRFEIDADAAEQSGLKISSKVLALAVSVKPPVRR